MCRSSKKIGAIMAKDEKVKFNRLSLLEAVAKLFHKVADFSKIVTEKAG
jgi:glycyl-tRNA synthetase beta subunit